MPVFVREAVVEDGLPAVQTELVTKEGVRQVELEAEQENIERITW